MLGNYISDNTHPYLRYCVWYKLYLKGYRGNISLRGNIGIIKLTGSMCQPLSDILRHLRS